MRHWGKGDFKALPEDVFQERLYAIRWISKESLGDARPKTYFSAPTEADLERECRVDQIVAENLVLWQEQGLVPDMAIEHGDETTRLFRERELDVLAPFVQCPPAFVVRRVEEACNRSPIVDLVPNDQHERAPYALDNEEVGPGRSRGASRFSTTKH